MKNQASVVNSGFSILLALFLLQGLSATAVEVTIVENAEKYRVIQIEAAVPSTQDVDYFQIWYATQPFTSVSDATRHSQVRVANTTNLLRVPIGEGYYDCWVDGQPIHWDPFGTPVVNPGSQLWSCALTGFLPQTDYWIAVVPMDAADQALVDINQLRPVQGRSNIADVLPEPPDMRPIITALSSIVIFLAALLIYLQRYDTKTGKASSRLAHAYVAPALIGLALLSLYPVCYGIWLSFTDAHQTRLGQESFIGLANFYEVLTSDGVLRVTLFTLVWSFSCVAFHVGLGLLLAVALTQARLKGVLFYRTILLIPWAIPGYISILAWRGMLQTDGLLNVILGTNIEFLSQVTSAQILVIMVNIWLGIPFMMMSLSGALMAIPQDMYEAAKLEGVSRWNQFRHLTLPNLKSSLVPLSLLGFIGTFNGFAVIYLITRGNPSVGFGQPGATDILITYVYDLAFNYGQYGIAAAWSVLIFLLLVSFSIYYLKQTRASESVS